MKKNSSGSITLVQWDAFFEDLQEIIKESVKEAIQSSNLSSSSQSIIEASKLLTRKQAAKLLGISLPTLSKYMKQGKIEYDRLGKKVLFDKQPTTRKSQMQFFI